MEVKTFKKAINDFLVSIHFSKVGSYYYSYAKDLTIVIGLQKSNYANGYYINIGYVISLLNPSIENPRDVDGHIRARFSFGTQRGRVDYFDLEALSENDENKLKEQIEENIKLYIEPVISLSELKILLQQNPKMLYQTKISAKRLLGFE